MLHGYLSNKESFLPQIRFLSRFFKVIAPDMTGFGNSEKMTEPYSLKDYAEEIKNLLDALKIDKTDAIAHSFGARVLVKLIENERRIDKIVLTGAAGLKPRRTLKYFYKRWAFLFLSKFKDKTFLSRFYSTDYNALDPVMKESFKLIVNERLEKNYSNIKNKTLLVFGSKDKETPLYMAKLMKKLVKGSKLLVIKNAGHFCFLDAPAAFDMAVFSFLTEK